MRSMNKHEKKKRKACLRNKRSLLVREIKMRRANLKGVVSIRLHEGPEKDDVLRADERLEEHIDAAVLVDVTIVTRPEGKVLAFENKIVIIPFEITCEGKEKKRNEKKPYTCTERRSPCIREKA